MADAKDDPEYPYDAARERANMARQDNRPAGSDTVERASCHHMVQSNGTCGLGGCSNYGKP